MTDGTQHELTAQDVSEAADLLTLATGKLALPRDMHMDLQRAITLLATRALMSVQVTSYPKDNEQKQPPQKPLGGKLKVVPKETLREPKTHAGDASRYVRGVGPKRTSRFRPDVPLTAEEIEANAEAIAAGHDGLIED